MHEEVDDYEYENGDAQDPTHEILAHDNAPKKVSFERQTKVLQPCRRIVSGGAMLLTQ